MSVKFPTEYTIFKFLDELQIKNEIYREKIEINILDITRESKKFLIDLETYLKGLSLYSSFDHTPDVKMIIKKINYFETVMTYMKSDIDLFTDEAIRLFLKMAGFQCYANALVLENIVNINFYIERLYSVIKLAEENKYSYQIEERHILDFVKRCYYLSYHEANFKPQEKCYNQYTPLISEDLGVLKEKSSDEYSEIFYKYCDIILDHKFYGIYEYDSYIDEIFFEEVLTKLKKEINEEIKKIDFTIVIFLFCLDLICII